ncbi:MAG: DNA-protecting protein DprA [bacterium]|nr:DNA-protecting protein DprA [bacterium]
MDLIEFKLCLAAQLKGKCFWKIKKKYGKDSVALLKTSKFKFLSLDLDLDQIVEDELKLVEEHNIKILAFDSPDYPLILKEIVDPPPFLFCKGDLTLLNSNCIAIIGSRYPTAYAKKVTAKLAEELAISDITIISGLARGIDSIAHKGALKTGKTVAVLGNGFGTVYPSENKQLYQEIAEKGLVLTEFLFKTAPLARNFPRRNRLVSGISKGVVVVEAAEKSGSLITANLAADQNKDVFAVPGELTNPNAKGPNQLIKDGAKMVTDAGDVLDEVFGVSKSFDFNEGKKEKLLATLDEEEKAIYDFIVSSHKPSFEDIFENVSMNVNILMGNLLSLEMKGAIKESSGKVYLKEI